MVISLSSDDSSSAHPKRIKKAAPGTPEFFFQSPAFVTFVSVCNVESDAFSCSAIPSPSQASEDCSMGDEVSDTVGNDEDASKPVEKRQYIGASNLLFWVTKLFIGDDQPKRCRICLSLPLQKLLLSKCFIICNFSNAYRGYRNRYPTKKMSPEAPFMESPRFEIKAEPVDPSTFLSQRPQPKYKKLGQTIEISSDEEVNVTPTPKAKR